VAVFYSEHDPTANNGFSVPVGSGPNIRCEVGPYTAQAGEKAIVATSGSCAMPNSSHFFRLETMRSIDGGAYAHTSLYPVVLNGPGGSGAIIAYGSGMRSQVVPLSAGSAYKFAVNMLVLGAGSSASNCSCTTVVQIVR
jgi:hypothetical protein